MFTFAGAYVLVLLALTCYVGWMASRQRRLTEQYSRLQKQFARNEESGSENPASMRQVA